MNYSFLQACNLYNPHGILVPMLEDQKPLQIPASKKWKGITIFCGKCKTNVSDICKEKKDGKPLKHCDFGNRHFYKLYLGIPGTSKRLTKNLGRDLDSAILRAIEFEKTQKENNYQTSVNKDKEEKKAKNVEQNKPDNIENAMARYVGFLNNDPEIVSGFREKLRSKKHLQDIERNFKHFIACLKLNGWKPSEIGINGITEQMLSKFHEYLLKNLELSNSSYNRIVTEFVCLYNFLINNQGFNIRNPFKGIPKRSVNLPNEIITEGEFKKLLEIVQRPELGKSKLSDGTIKYLHKPFVKDFIEMGLYSGRRTDEIAHMTWDNVFTDDKGKPVYIKIVDFKATRQKDNPKYVFVPATEELHELLLRLGYEQYKGSDKYILASEESMKRETIKSIVSHSFSHYYKQLGTGRNLSYKSLRKTYISRLTAFIGIDKARLITKHSGTQVMEDHYINLAEISLTATGFKMFEKPNASRQNELKQLRNNQEPNNPER